MKLAKKVYRSRIYSRFFGCLAKQHRFSNLKIIANCHKLSQTYEVTCFASHVGQKETIDLLQKGMKFSSYKNSREKMLLLLSILYVKESK